jgi:hypothetical protein
MTLFVKKFHFIEFIYLLHCEFTMDFFNFTGHHTKGPFEELAVFRIELQNGNLQFTNLLLFLAKNRTDPVLLDEFNLTFEKIILNILNSSNQLIILNFIMKAISLGFNSFNF